MEVGAEVWVRDPGPETWVGGVVIKKVSGGSAHFSISNRGESDDAVVGGRGGGGVPLVCT
jgi:hypothetical protein